MKDFELCGNAIRQMLINVVVL